MRQKRWLPAFARRKIFYVTTTSAGEIIIADHGSSDGSQAMAETLGARVVPVSKRGYGSAFQEGFDAAQTQ